MSLREFERVARIHHERERIDQERSLAGLALQTAELVNIVGAMGAGQKWKAVTAKQYFDAWTGAKVLDLDETRRRLEQAQATSEARKERERWSF